MTDTGAEATGEHDLPDDLYEEAEGVALRLSSPGPEEHSPVHVETAAPTEGVCCL